MVIGQVVLGRVTRPLLPRRHGSSLYLAPARFPILLYDLSTIIVDMLRHFTLCGGYPI